MEFIGECFTEEDDIRFEDRFWRICRTLRAVGNLLLEDFIFDFLAAYRMLTYTARRCGERSMALYETLDGTEMFERVDVLRVVPKQLFASLEFSYEVVR